MKKLYSLAVVLVLILATVLYSGVATAAAKSSNILEFGTMVGVPRPYTGATNAIRGVPGGGLPWVIGFGHGELNTNGKLEVTVKGLVLDPNDPAVIAAGLAGRNPSPNFKAIVSCLSKDASGNPLIVNVSTDVFPATTTGDASIEATVNLPSPCIAPIIFVTNPGGSWFASTGF